MQLGLSMSSIMERAPLGVQGEEHPSGFHCFALQQPVVCPHNDPMWSTQWIQWSISDPMEGAVLDP